MNWCRSINSLHSHVTHNALIIHFVIGWSPTAGWISFWNVSSRWRHVITIRYVGHRGHCPLRLLTRPPPCVGDVIMMTCMSRDVCDGRASVTCHRNTHWRAEQLGIVAVSDKGSLMGVGGADPRPSCHGVRQDCSNILNWNTLKIVLLIPCKFLIWLYIIYYIVI